MQDVEFLSELKVFGRNQNETSGLRRFLCADSEAAYLVGIANFDRSITKPTLEARIQCDNIKVTCFTESEEYLILGTNTGYVIISNNQIEHLILTKSPVISLSLVDLTQIDEGIIIGLKSGAIEIHKFESLVSGKKALNE